MKKTFTDAVSEVLAGADPDHVADQVPAETPAPETKPAEKKKTIGAAITDLVMDATLSYDAIVGMIHAEFKGCSTTARSVASVAARLRKDGVDVPKRRGAKAATE